MSTSLPGTDTTTKVFMSGTSQAVRIPAAFRFDCETVLIRREGNAVILQPVPQTWDELCIGEPEFVEDMLQACNDDDLKALEDSEQWFDD